jgi:hypothetical protein
VAERRKPRVVTQRDYGPVERATRAELRALNVSVQTSILAANAVSLARQIDGSPGAVAAAAASLQLRLTRADLVAEAAEQPERDVIDDLNARRAARRAAG